MIYKLNETHDPKAKSWVESANVEGAPFPIQNLPLGVYRASDNRNRIGVGIGDSILDLRGVIEANLFDPVSDEVKKACKSSLLNELMALTPKHWSELRNRLFHFLHESASSERQKRGASLLVPRNSVVMELPCRIGDYTDFYAGIYHAMNVGSLFRPENPLLPNYKWIPIAYHGRVSSIVVSGTPIGRPRGQTKSPDSDKPTFGASKRLDYELELGFYIAQGNALGTPIPIDRAEGFIFGVCLLNDWSARDIQTWEYQPLGPFLAKSFATTISPWIVTMEALAPFHCAAFARSAGEPAVLPYLHSGDDQKKGALDILLEVSLATQEMRQNKTLKNEIPKNEAANDGVAPFTTCRTSSKHLYWTPAQCLAHHASNGCNLQPGDLFGSGTISGPHKEEIGSLLELTRGGSLPLKLPNGQQRTFLEDGDMVIMRAWCRADGYVPISLGECTGMIIG